MSSLPWFTDSSNQTRRNRSSFIPPHSRRTQPEITVTIPSHYASRGRRRNAAGPFDHDVIHKFNELDVSSQDEQETKNVPVVEATGTDIPPPVTSFSEIGFSSEALINNIKRCKYVKPTPIQRYAIPVAIAGRDLMACAQTGSGKTAAFCFPIINGIMLEYEHRNNNGRGAISMACPMALILAPTRELACQIHDEAKKFSYQTGVNVVAVYGGAPIFQQLRNLEKGVDILVATPGRLVDLIERTKVSLRNIKYLALDEADRMLDMGFEHQVRKIVQQMEMPPPGSRQTMLFSATFPDEIQALSQTSSVEIPCEAIFLPSSTNLGSDSLHGFLDNSFVQKLASDFLSNYIFLAAGKVGSSTDLIVQRVEFVRDMDKQDHLVNLLRRQKTNSNPNKDALTLVFVETKRGADALEHWLSRKGFPSISIHGDKVQVERERALKSFRSGRTPILVATDVAARGLDIPHVAHVINFDLPRAVDDYVHRIGRTGRAGKTGLATAFFSEKNVPLAKALVQLMQEANQQVPPFLTEYAKTSSNGYGNGRKFGGYGFGNGVNSDDYSSRFADTSTYAVTPTASTYGDSYAASSHRTNMKSLDVAGSNVSDSHNNAYNWGPVVASGWD